MMSKKLDKNIKVTIVIVDDSRDEHFFIKDALRDFNNVLYNDYYNGEDFLRFLEERRKKPRHLNTLPDIVILDVNMPGMSGFEVFDVVEQKGLNYHIQFYILTTSVTELEKKNCKKYGLRCYQKPFNINDFTALLEDMIRRTIDK